MHPIDGEEDAVPMLRDAIAAPFVDAIGAAAGLSAAATRSLLLVGLLGQEAHFEHVALRKNWVPT